ncbi:MAG: hypothetical protein CM15mV108_380 [uncultured marine virus]|nr:MAG: hypothetical protein CM15mV108_380 [uncultured marine virus]
MAESIKKLTYLEITGARSILQVENHLRELTIMENTRENFKTEESNLRILF